MSARILVADDDSAIRNLVAFTLRRRDYSVLEACDGGQALDLARKERPDLVVLDVMMPGLSGLEVARAMAEDSATSAIPILILSAKGQAAEIDAGLASGARAYLVKPFAPRDLAARVLELLPNDNTRGL